MLLCAPGPARAFVPRVAASRTTVHARPAGTVVVNGGAAVTILTPSDGIDPFERAQAIAARLQRLTVGGPLSTVLTTAKLPGGASKVVCGAEILVVIDPAEAAAHHLKPLDLARAWATRLQSLLSEPGLHAAAAGCTVPVGERRTFRVGGAAPAADVTVQDEDVAVGRSTFDPVRRLVTVDGLSPGRDTILVQGDGTSIKVPVAVMNRAAKVAPYISIQVTGDPSAPAPLVKQALYAGLARAIDAQPGGFLVLGHLPKITRPLLLGRSVTVSVPLKAAGPNLLPVHASVAVSIRNSPVTPRAATALLYSNNPEQLKHGQMLFSGLLAPFQPARLDYHHQNVSGGPLVFHADLVNSGSEEAEIQVISGVSLPGADTVQVGRRAGARFLQAFDAQNGLVLVAPPHSRVPMVTQRFASGLTVSGIVQMQQINGPGDSVSVQVSADDDNSTLTTPVARLIQAALGEARSASPLPEEPTDYGSGTPLPVLSPYVFDAPEISLDTVYRIGDHWTYAQIGQAAPLHDRTGKLSLGGNYGALYRITVDVSNPTPDERPVGVFFNPEAGSAAGVFRVDDGPIQEFDAISPPAEREIARYVLPAGASRTVTVDTIPLNGSFYPAALVVHAL